MYGDCGNVPKSKKGKIIDGGEFGESWNKGLVDWDIGERILAGEGGDFHEMDSRELEADKGVNIAI